MSRRLVHRPARPGQGDAAFAAVMSPRVNPQVASYFPVAAQEYDAADWTTMPEIPASAELSTTDGTMPAVHLAPNVRFGAWPDKDTYLKSQYCFLREEAVRPLREAVSHVKAMPTANEDAFGNDVGIYERVHIVGWVASTRGLAMRITFSTKRVGKKIIWQQAKRLMTGSLVALTPSSDMFRKKIVVATVAARPLEALQQSPPELDLFFARPEEVEIDPATEWTMVEARGGFFEAERYTMLAIQKLAREPFQLEQQIVSVDTDLAPPLYISTQPFQDLTTIYGDEDAYRHVNVVESWPHSTNIDLDESQQAAVQRMFNTSLSIVQGPPGTGKTFVSIKQVRALLANMADGAPPLIVTAQTNHALDQLLRLIAEFEKDFIRLGGRSKDKEVVFNRTLYNVRRATEQPRLRGCSGPGARKEMQRLEGLMADLLKPLSLGMGTLDARTLLKHDILTAEQVQSLEDGAQRWCQATVSSGSSAPASSAFGVWARQQLSQVPFKPALQDFGFEVEEEELEFEDLLDIEAENAIKDDDFVDALKGGTYTLADNFTCRSPGLVTSHEVRRLLAKHNNLWNIKGPSIASVYLHLQAELKRVLLTKFRDLALQYSCAAKSYRIGQWENDEVLLRAQRVIGCTTTGLSKYRGLLAALGCKIVLVEEAAETLEAPVLAACLPTVEHLILVGDHKQLRPHCKVPEHEKPLNYNISLFERLVDNSMGLTTLVKQRRMIPEIRRLLKPIYGDIIQDHDFVQQKLNRPDVAGMGGVNSYFFDHKWAEQRDELMSCYNENEARMVIGLASHLVYNGMSAEKITILTFYNGQRKKLERLKNRCANLGPRSCQVVTVDSYQGEENQVVILSLVRSNSNGVIGFLANKNRVCVALSRAQRGFYMFGNAALLHKDSTWRKIINILLRNKLEPLEATSNPDRHRVFTTLPITCERHGTTLEFGEPEGWEDLVGGCRKGCAKVYECGHKCTLLCHPFEHASTGCGMPCSRLLPCGHLCSVLCGQTCVCLPCTQGPRTASNLRDGRGSSAHSTSVSSSSWQTINDTDVYIYAQQLQPPLSILASSAAQTVASEKEELLIEI